MVACCGGVNAVAVAAVLPLGVIWILTRAGGPRKWRLLGWWTLFQRWPRSGGPPAPRPGSLQRAVPRLHRERHHHQDPDGPDPHDGRGLGLGGLLRRGRLPGRPADRLDAVPVARRGGGRRARPGGLCLRGHPHQRFLALGTVAGANLVGFGYAADLHGFFASDRAGARRVAGTAAQPAQVRRGPADAARPRARHASAGAQDARGTRPSGPWGLAGATVLGSSACAAVAPRQHRPERASCASRLLDERRSYLEEHRGRTPRSRSLPSSFGVYTWGNMHDDILQGLAGSPWAVRNVIPLAQPGNVVFLDKSLGPWSPATPAPSSPRSSPTTASAASSSATTSTVSGRAPRPVVRRSALESVPGLTLARSFGPKVGEPTWPLHPTAASGW